MSEVVCKLEDDLCRCCHSEGAYKNLTGVYNFGGIEEIYYDMLRDTFDINLNPMPGLLCVSTYTICDACIEKLRDATNFKKQVLFYEDKFKEMISKNLIRGAESDDVLEIKQEETDEVFSRIPGNRVKVKKRSVSTTLSDHNDDVDWHCDDELLDEDHKGQSEVPKKKSKRAQSKTKGRSKKDLNKKKKIKMESSAENKDNAEGVAQVDDYIAVRSDPNKRYSCTACQLSYRRISDLRYHVIRVHLKMNFIKCHYCPQKFKYHSQRKQHANREHCLSTPDKYACDHCGRQFNRKNALAEHMQAVHVKRKCLHCDMRFARRDYMFHMNEEHGVAMPTCGICGHRTLLQSALVRHQRNVHLKERDKQCSLCPKTFCTRSNLKEHMVSHEKERVHKCDVCSKSFARRGCFTTHYRIHTGERPFSCDVCKASFVQRASLRFHMRSRHLERP